MLAIVKKNLKPLATYVPVPDRIMFNNNYIAGATVPNNANKNKRINADEGYYSNDSSCCYSLEDRLSKDEKEDVRENLAWNVGIGTNVVTADDADTFDTFYAKTGVLDNKAIPHPRYPKKEMHSKIASELGYWPMEKMSSVRLKANGGISPGIFWGGPACLWDNPYKGYPWTYKCGNNYYDYQDKFVIRGVKNEKYGAASQILSHDSKQCLTGKKS
ncbi:hypothetical protein ACFFJN_04300 [Erwinia mallotivora]|uniref:hypothetical protein n=1 Tax=Erwinia mallotivora TaxID=69222 RepID=UPI0035F0CF94